MKWLKSKTILSLVLLVIINGLQATVPEIKAAVPDAFDSVVDLVLVIVAAYGRINPKVN